MRPLGKVALGFALSLAIVGTAHAQVQVTMGTGRVSIVAKNVTVADILTEWAKVGQIKVDHLELVPRDRVTVELRNATEQEALAVLLRHGGGYMAQRRETFAPGTSGFERILVVPFVPPSPRVIAATSPANGGSPTAGANAATAITEQEQAEQTAAARAVAEAMQRQQMVLEYQPQVRQADATQDPELPPAVNDALGNAMAVQPQGPLGPIPEAQSQATIRARGALETTDASKFKFPKPQPVVQPVTVPRGPGGL